MITLPQIAQQKTVDNPGVPKGQLSDSEGVVEDFLKLVRTAKAGLTPEAEDAPQIPGSGLRKVVIKNDSLKLAAELANGKVAAEPQETLAALLAPQGKGATATKALLTANDKTDTDNDPDLQAISALFAMLPHQESAQSLIPTSADKLSVASKASPLAIAANPQAVAEQTVETEKSRTASSENSVGRFAPADDKVSLRTADNQTASAHPQPALSPAISSSAPLVSTGAPIAAPATPILNSQLGSQEWQQQLSQQVMLFTRQGQQQAELRLHPEHLGKVEISLKLDDNQLQLQIMSPHSHVRAALEAALPMLRTSLSESGLQLGQSQVGGEGSMQQQHAEQREQQASRQNGTFSLEPQDEDDVTLTGNETLQRLAQNKGAVDTFA